MIFFLALAAATAAPAAAPTSAPACAVGGGNGYTASLIAPVAVAQPPPKPVAVAKPKPLAKPHPKRAKLSLGCTTHKKR